MQNDPRAFPRFRLVEAKLRTSSRDKTLALDQWLTGRRQAGMSFEAISREIHRTTGEEISRVTVAAWCKGLAAAAATTSP